MKKKYNEIEIKIFTLQAEDIVTFSIAGMVDGDGTKYSIPSGWKYGWKY